LKDGGCPIVDLTQPANVALAIENVFSPQSLVGNPIGFQILPAKFSYEYPATVIHTLANDYPLHGLMNVTLSHVFIRKSDGIVLPLNAENAVSLGLISSNGSVVHIRYDSPDDGPDR
jgi:hypothetical protein